MKRMLNIALALIASAHAVEQEQSSRESEMNQIMSEHVNNLDPRVIVMPEPGFQGGTPLTYEGSGGAFDNGLYYNTTRIEENHQYYKYMWKHACAYTKWTPSNQFLHANQNQLNLKKMNMGQYDLSRFGLIGSEKKCFWGMIGVLWKKPLGLAKHELTVDFEFRQIDIGTKGKMIDGKQVLQQLPKDQRQHNRFKPKDPTMMNIGAVPMEFLNVKGLIMLYQPDLGMNIDLLTTQAERNANVVLSKPDVNKATQYWKIVRAVETQPITDSWSPVLISSMDGKWCIARVTDDVEVPDGSDPDAAFGVKQEMNIKLTECYYNSGQGKASITWMMRPTTFTKLESEQGSDFTPGTLPS